LGTLVDAGGCGFGALIVQGGYISFPPKTRCPQPRLRRQAPPSCAMPVPPVWCAISTCTNPAAMAS
jgi:hypothetical protein